MVGVITTPVPLGSVSLDPFEAKYPVNIIGYDKNGDSVGVIDESKLTAVQRIILGALEA